VSHHLARCYRNVTHCHLLYMASHSRGLAQDPPQKSASRPRSCRVENCRHRWPAMPLAPLLSLTQLFRPLQLHGMWSLRWPPKASFGATGWLNVCVSISRDGRVRAATEQVLLCRTGTLQVAQTVAHVLPESAAVRRSDRCAGRSPGESPMGSRSLASQQLDRPDSRRPQCGVAHITPQ
jgi:hypothetical protein